MMWDVIKQNRKKSIGLFVGMAILLVLLGFFLGNVFDPERGGVIGIFVAIGLWLAMTFLSLHSADDILLKVSGAREITKDVHPRLFNVVEEMKIAAGLPAMPRVFIVDEPSPNAFAIGVSPEKSVVAVTAGLLSRLNRDELQGVIAHEIAHIVNRDSQLMTMAGIMLGAIVLLSQSFLRSWWFLPTSSRRYRKSVPGGGNPQLQAILIGVAFLLAILAPIFARLLYLGISRQREFLADATAVQLTRYPEGLASALEKISSDAMPLEAANPVTAPMFIVSPLLKKQFKLNNLGSTHPPIKDRIGVLRFMSKGADYFTYQRAFSRMRGKPTPLIGENSLDEETRITIREPSPSQDPPLNDKTQKRDMMDLMRALNDYAFLACACGLRMKLPADLPQTNIECPKCGRENKVPKAELAVLEAVMGASVAGGSQGAATASAPAVAAAPPQIEYTRQGTGWESFSCACDSLLQLSPSFRGHHVWCRSCGRNVVIHKA